MGCLHEASIWLDNSRSLCSIYSVTTGRVYFDVALHCAFICNAIRRFIVGWVTSTVVTIIIGMC